MSFLFPAFLLGALTVAIPVFLHLLRRERAPLAPFSAVRFVRRSPTLRARRLRLREWLLLALRVTALLLLTAAFARPYLDRATPRRPVTVVALDRSLSLSAPGRMEQARALAAAAVADAPAGHRVALVAYDDRADVVLGATDDRAAAVAAVEAVAATGAATRHAAGLTAAGALAEHGGRIVVVSDLQATGWSDGETAAAPAAAFVELAAVEPAPANLAVIAATRTPDGVSAVVRNAGSAPRDALVVLSLDGAVLESRVAPLAPGANTVRFERALPAAGVAAVEVVDRDGFAGDNRRPLRLDAPAPVRVLAVADGGRNGGAAFFVDRALAAGGGAAPFALRVTAPDAVSALDASAWEPLRAVLVLGAEGLDQAGRERLAAFVRAGGGLLVAVGPGAASAANRLLGVDAVLADAPQEASAVRRWVTTERRHPLIRRLGVGVEALGEIAFRAVVPLGEGAGARVLGRFDDGAPALVEYTVEAGRALLFASDLSGAGSDFPRRPGFAPFVHEALRHVARLPPPTPDAQADARESDPTPATPEAFLARIERLPQATGAAADAGARDPQERERQQAVWWYALAALLVVLVGEAWLARGMA